MNCWMELIAKFLKEKLHLQILLSMKKIRKDKKKMDVNDIVNRLLRMGVAKNDSILIHSSMSHINGSAQELIDALKEIVGENGNILMPTHPILKKLENGDYYYNPTTAPSKVGYLTEYFRKLPNVKRSLHPFSSVAVLGKNADWFLENNIKGIAPLPHGVNSPYYKLAQKGGKIICIGVTAQARATISHVPEEVLDEKFPLDVTEAIEVWVQSLNEKKKLKFRHTILSFSKIYKCKSQLEKDWIQWGVLQKDSVNGIPLEVLDAKKCVELMIKKVTHEGETVYPMAPKTYERVKKNLNARVLYVNNNILFAARGNELYQSIDNGYTWKLYIRFPVDTKTKLLMNIPLLARLLRYGIHHCTLNNGNGIVMLNKKIYYIENNKIKQVDNVHGSRPMIVCPVDNGIYYGEYKTNQLRTSINVWKLDYETKEWKVVWIFENVRHIHGVFYDKKDNSIWVTTGDSDEESAIWKTNDEFKSLQKIVGGSQQFRTVQLLFSEEYVYFGSDAPSEQNYIYRMTRDGKDIKCLTQVGGSIFYGVEVSGSYFFSTAAEPSNCNSVKYVELWRSDNGIDWYIYKRFKKDIWSMKYFQYGQIYFPYYDYENHNSVLYFTPFATDDSMQTFTDEIIEKDTNKIIFNSHDSEVLKHFPSIPIQAEERYLISKSDTYGWFVSDTCVIAYFIEKKFIFKRLVFTTSIITSERQLNIMSKKLFLDSVISYIQRYNICDFIYKAQSNVVFDVCPKYSKCVPWGTYLVDLRKDSDSLFQSFNQKARNAIRKALKNEVQVSKVENVDKVYENIKVTMKRQKSIHYPKYSYFKKLQKFSHSVCFFVVKKDNFVQGSLVLVYDKNNGYAMYAGSIKKPLTGSLDLLHFEAMKFLQQKNISTYDFTGTRINIKKGSKQEGIDRFKRKFSPTLKRGYAFKTIINPIKYMLFSLSAEIYFKMFNLHYVDPIEKILYDDELIDLND